MTAFYQNVAIIDKSRAGVPNVFQANMSSMFSINLSFEINSFVGT